jgi:hypothetical protein
MHFVAGFVLGLIVAAILMWVFSGRVEAQVERIESALLRVEHGLAERLNAVESVFDTSMGAVEMVPGAALKSSEEIAEDLARRVAAKLHELQDRLER